MQVDASRNPWPVDPVDRSEVRHEWLNSPAARSDAKTRHTAEQPYMSAELERQRRIEESRYQHMRSRAQKDITIPPQLYQKSLDQVLPSHAPRPARMIPQMPLARSWECPPTEALTMDGQRVDLPEFIEAIAIASEIASQGSYSPDQFLLDQRSPILNQDERWGVWYQNALKKHTDAPRTGSQKGTPRDSKRSTPRTASLVATPRTASTGSTPRMSADQLLEKAKRSVKDAGTHTVLFAHSPRPTSAEAARKIQRKFKLQEAEGLLRRAVHHEPDHKGCHLLLGEVLMENRKFTEANFHMSKALGGADADALDEAPVEAVEAAEAVEETLQAAEKEDGEGFDGEEDFEAEELEDCVHCPGSPTGSQQGLDLMTRKSMRQNASPLGVALPTYSRSQEDDFAATKPTTKKDEPVLEDQVAVAAGKAKQATSTYEVLKAQVDMMPPGSEKAVALQLVAEREAEMKDQQTKLAGLSMYDDGRSEASKIRASYYEDLAAKKDSGRYGQK